MVPSHSECELQRPVMANADVVERELRVPVDALRVLFEERPDLLQIGESADRSRRLMLGL